MSYRIIRYLCFCSTINRQEYMAVVVRTPIRKRGCKDTFPGVCTPVLRAHSVRVFILALPPYTPVTLTPTALLLALIF